jgi:hypothetical protein
MAPALHHASEPILAADWRRGGGNFPVMATERRRLVRLPGPFDGRWSGASGGHHCLLTNVNTVGCFVSFIGSQTVGDVVLIMLSDGDDPDPLTLHGSVMSLDPGIGFEVQFWELDAAKSARLGAWLADRGLASTRR